MGQEISQSHFRKCDFSEFNKRLQEETEILKEWFEEDRFVKGAKVAGYELEACLIDQEGNPSPSNADFLESLNDDEVVAELAKYNIEINGQPMVLAGSVLSELQSGLERKLKNCSDNAEKMGLGLVGAGILPTLKNRHLGMGAMSESLRYKALNEQVLRLREGEPIHLNLEGEDHLKLDHLDVMLEAAATSFQIHMQVDPDEAAHYYNVCKIISAPLVAVSANSPYLFGNELWEESRIPLFEQAVSVGGTAYCRRVTFGVRYLTGHIFDVYEANQERYPILLPLCMGSDAREMKHLNLHNGTIWRWTRPIIGFDGDGRPTVRMEHRTIPAGPTLVDQVANMAFFFGLVTELAKDKNLIEKLSHESCLANFYRAARHGMNTKVKWLNGKDIKLQNLLDELIPGCRNGLKTLGIEDEDAEYYLNIIQNRINSKQTGAAWQKSWVEKYGKDWQGLVLAYKERQEIGKPVSSWMV